MFDNIKELKALLYRAELDKKKREALNKEEESKHLQRLKKSNVNSTLHPQLEEGEE